MMEEPIARIKFPSLEKIEIEREKRNLDPYYDYVTTRERMLGSIPNLYEI